MLTESMRNRYFELLKDYVSHPQEEALAATAELGRWLVQTEVPPEGIAALHQQALRRLAEESPDLRLLETSRLISRPLMQLLASYGLAFGERLERHRRALQVLRERERKYRSIYRTAAVSIWEEDFSAVKQALDELKTQGVADVRQYLLDHPRFVQQAVRMVEVVDVNDASLRLFGAKTKAELMGSLDRLFLRQSFEVFREELIAIAAGKRHFEAEALTQTLQGEPRHIFLTLSIPAETSQFRHLLVSMMDITERKRMEAALRESEARFRRLAEATFEGIAIHDEGTVIDANQAFADLFGRTLSEVIGQDSLKWATPETRKTVLNQIRSGSERPYEGTGIRKDGSTTYLEIHGKNISLEGKRLRVVALRDITERKRMEAALQRSEREQATRSRIARVFLTFPDEEMYGEVLGEILEVMESPYGVFGYINENGDLIAPSMTREVSDQCQVVDKDLIFRRDTWGWESTWRRAIAEKRPIFSNQPPTNVPEGHFSIFRHISLPILYQGETIGLFQVANRETDYDEKDVRVLAAIADYVAPILHARLEGEKEERARKLAENRLQARARQQAAVAELGQRALAGAHLSPLMDEAVACVAQTLDVEFCKVLELLPDRDALLLRAGVGWRDGAVGQATVSTGIGSQAGYTLLSEEPVIVEDLRSETRFSGPALLLDHDVVSGMSVIIRGHRRTWGVMGAHTTGLRTFTEDDVYFLQSVANVLAEAIERKWVENQLMSSLEEKEVLLKEVHHRVKNNMQIISSLLNLGSRHINDQQDIEIFRESQNRIRSMALIHERLYQSENLARIRLADYIRDLTSYLLRSYEANRLSIALKINIADVFLGVDKAIPCGLILNELVSNSLKYAFPEGRSGEINIELHSTPDARLRLIVWDNGIGFPDDMDFRHTESLGLQLVMTLVEQLQGNIELERSGGARFEIAFPGGA